MSIFDCRSTRSKLIVLLLNVFACRVFSSTDLYDDFDVVVGGLSRSDAERSHRRLAFGDYSEVPEFCPALTSCPQICVMNATDCPTMCPPGQNLCLDGSCTVEPCDDTLISPCWCPNFKTACPRVVNFFNTCLVDFGEYYDEYKTCVAVYLEELVELSYAGPWFVFFYIWIISVTILVFGWCLYNQKLCPVKGSTVALTPVTRGVDDLAHQWTQTGYKNHLVGLTINLLVWITLFMFHSLMFFLTICYYIQQEAILRWPVVFEDDIQVLFVFQLVWMIGFFWSFSFMWPETIASLFRRRCALNEATFVAVVAPVMRVESIAKRKGKFFDEIARFLWLPFKVALCFFFSCKETPPECELVYCQVDPTSFSFIFRMGRYVYSESDGVYIPGVLDLGTTLGEYLDMRDGLTVDQARLHYQLVGPNILVLEKPVLWRCLYNEFSKTFYLYQTFMLWTWFNYWYYHMALIATVVRVIGGTVVGIFQYQSDCVMYKLTEIEGNAEVIRDGQRTTISVIDLVPGDVVVLKPGPIYCDMLILQTHHMLVDESALTGESNPVAKIKLDPDMRKAAYNETRHKQYTLFAGTTMLENGTEGEDLGVVMATGSFTQKGQLLCDILSYKRHKLQFDEEIIPVLMILGVEAAGLVSMVFVFMFQRDQPYVVAWFYAMFVLATIFPPLLPTVFVVSVGISAKRLKQKRIACTYSEGILVAGKVNVCCFDKTGTLTEAGMNASGIDCGGKEELKKYASVGMAVCHNLKVMGNGEIVGNEVDKASFEFSGATIDIREGKDMDIVHLGQRYMMLKQNLFDNTSVTQSVIVETQDGKRLVFVKGSPEAVRAICRPETIPSSFDETLRTGSKAGLYQLGMAYKELEQEKDAAVDLKSEIEIPFNPKVSMIPRRVVESSLTFCGFVNFENILKKESSAVMQDLKEGNVLLTMITGDNVLTGVRIARECGICVAETTILAQKGPNNRIEWVNVDMDEVVSKPLDITLTFDLAITGEAWATLLAEDPEYAKLIVKHIRVFGRCKPDDKVSVITTLVQLGYTTLMCGDGQNDCGALKSAHVGVALSTADASIVAPFTSLDLTVTSVTEILREGRCALSSALKVYTYFMLYGQLCSMLQTINSYFVTTFNGWAWVFLDGIWPVMMAFALPLATAARKLSSCRPTASLFGARTIASTCGLLGWNLVYLILAIFLLFQQDWFQCRKWDGSDMNDAGEIQDNYETETMFIVGGSQYISTGIALGFGYTFRAAWYKNYWFVGFSIAFMVMQYVLALYPSKFSCIFRVNCSNENVVLDFAQKDLLPIQNPFNTTVFPAYFRWTLAILMTANLVTLCAWEYFFVNTFLYKIFSFGKDEALPSSSKLTSPKKISDEKITDKMLSDKKLSDS